MASITIFIPAIASFLVTLLLMPFWIRKAKQIGLLWNDMNKFEGSKVAGSGGIIAILGFVMGVLVYIAYRVFYLHEADGFLIDIFALLSVVLIITMVGLVDDLLGWQRGGLSKKSRLILVAFAAIPLMAINAGVSEISVPFLGSIDLSIIYPLILVPIGILGATTTFNFLAGFNGLEAGQGILLLSGLGVVAYFTSNSWLAVVALCMIASLAAFLFYNIFPAKIFPGDVLTYPVGGLIAIMAILGNFEKIAVFFFIPVIIEVFLKARGGFAKQSFGLPKGDGTLEMKYDKIYSLNHLAIWVMNKTGVRATEKRVVLSIWIFQAAIIVLGMIIFRKGIFLF